MTTRGLSGRRFRRLSPALILSVILTPSLAGCGGGDAVSVAEVPKSDPSQARKALESALNAWKAGEAVDSLAKATPPVQVFDTQREKGKAIDGFTIVGEPSGGAGSGQIFTVGLKFKGSTSETKARYLVAGSDPIQVYHEADFAKLLNPDAGAPSKSR